MYILFRKKQKTFLSEFCFKPGWGNSNQITFLKIILSRPTFRCQQETDSWRDVPETHGLISYGKEDLDTLSAWWMGVSVSILLPGIQTQFEFPVQI